MGFFSHESEERPNELIFIIKRVMKKIKLTEETLIRIVERVIKEQDKKDANKILMSYFQQLKDADGEEEKKEINAKITQIISKNPNLAPLGGAITPFAKTQGITK